MARKTAPPDTQDNPAYPNCTDTDIFIRGFTMGYNANEQADKLADALRKIKVIVDDGFNSDHICKEEQIQSIADKHLTEYDKSKV